MSTSRRRRLIAAGATGAAVLAAGVLLSAPASASTQTFHGCPAGAVCLYTNDANSAKYFANQPTYVFYSYGGHNISGAYGFGEYVDNQYGGTNIGSYLCSGYNGTGTTLSVSSGPNSTGGVHAYTAINFTPVNSVLLTTAWSPSQPKPC